MIQSINARKPVKPPVAKSWLKWRVVLLCFLAQNCAMGIAFGSYGPLLASNEEHFGISRAAASFGMSLITLSVGTLSPIAGSLLAHISVRTALVIGTALTGFSYWGLALCSSYGIALALFAIIGGGVCVVAILGPLTIISHWFETDRGKVLAFVNLPILLFLSPYLVGELLPVYGRTWIVGGIGTIFLILAPLLALIVDRPAMAGLKPHGSRASESTGANMAESTDRVLTKREILTNPSFCLLHLGIGVVAGSGTAFMVHIVPYGMESHMSLQEASLLLSFYAGAGIFGTLLFGWIADSLGPPTAWVITAFCQAILWWGLLQVSGAPLFVLAALLGICVVPQVTLQGAAVTALFGAANASRTMGFGFAIMLPFIFSFAPVVGYLYDQSGSYQVPFLLTSGMLAAACAFFFILLLITRKNRLPVNVT